MKRTASEDRITEGRSTKKTQEKETKARTPGGITNFPVCK